MKECPPDVSAIRPISSDLFSPGQVLVILTGMLRRNHAAYLANGITGSVSSIAAFYLQV